MLTAATRDSEESEWYIKNFLKMVGAHRVDQKLWTEEDATTHGLYSDTIKPFNPKPTPGVGEKLGIATVVDGRVVWPVVSKSTEELAADELAVKVAALAACQCPVTGQCMMMPVFDDLVATGAVVLANMEDQEFVANYLDRKQLLIDTEGA